MKMKFTFVSNMLHHHQQPFCEAMAKRLSGNFHFVTTMPLSEELKTVGYLEQDSAPPYLVPSYNSSQAREKAEALVRESDVVLYGSECTDSIIDRIRSGKLTFAYSERLFKGGVWKVIFPRVIHSIVSNHTRWRWHKNLHMLCAGAYTSLDMRRAFAYPDRCWKWGYFTDVPLNYSKETHPMHLGGGAALIWVGRFLKWKHPEMAISLASQLRELGYVFQIKIAGMGPLRENLVRKIKASHLEQWVKLMGPLPNPVVRVEMENAHIHLFTSDNYEGWGAVLNESMASGCTPVVSHRIGSAPYLLRDGINGLIFESGNQIDFNNCVTRLLSDIEFRKRLGVEARKTMTQWSPEVAAERIIEFSSKLLQGEKVNDLFADGPCSPAQVLTERKYLESVRKTIA